MRRFDKKENIRNANILLEKRTGNLNEDVSGNVGNREVQVALHRLETIINDFMVNGDVDPQYKSLIQKELDNINDVTVKRDNYFKSLYGKK